MIGLLLSIFYFFFFSCFNDIESIFGNISSIFARVVKIFVKQVYVHNGCLNRLKNL